MVHVSICVIQHQHQYEQFQWAKWTANKIQWQPNDITSDHINFATYMYYGCFNITFCVYTTKPFVIKMILFRSSIAAPLVFHAITIINTMTLRNPDLYFAADIFKPFFKWKLEIWTQYRKTCVDHCIIFQCCCSNKSLNIVCLIITEGTLRLIITSV